MPEPASDLPPVLVQREELKEQLEAPAAAVQPPVPEQAAMAVDDEAASAAMAVARIGREPARKGRAAFTLRLEPARHLRLRLAGAMTHRSAQRIVSEALDIYLNSLPEVEDLARQCSPAGDDRLGD